MLHIGILAHSADGAALCFLEMIRESARALGPHLHPEITLSILPMGEVLDAWELMDLETVNRHLMRTAQRLKSAGCDFFVCPDNTLLGTKWTMEGPAYPAAVARAGLEMSTPAREDRVRLDRIIFDELCQGRFTDAARAEFVRVIDRLRAEGCDAVALSCTEIPILVRPGDSPLPTLDSTRLLAHEAVRVAQGKSPMPVWRGGARNRSL
ncbi:MAG: aspartate racemase [Deltaproteobacteria bacterium]|nr:MAG: aspartate racemase [Deltaproteobacteria bacterium]